MSRLTRGLTATLVAMSMAAVPAAGSILASAPAARAEANPPPGTDLKPVLGWSTWSFFRRTSDAAIDEAAARAMKRSGLERLGYRYINQDDFWYRCPGRQGPDVDRYGRWVVRPSKFPRGRNGENGIAVVASYVHGLGLKFGIYVTPGISDQAVARNTPILGTSYTAAGIATKTRQNNYNCGGMTGIDYAKPGAQAYVNSIAREFARWGVDYIKLDGITDQNKADIQAWSVAIRQSGRPMQLDVTEGSYTVALGRTLDKYATQWEYTSDVENYGGRGLTDYTNVRRRFTTLARWEPTYGGQKFDAYNDFDSVEVGNCRNAVGSTGPIRLGLVPGGRRAERRRAEDRAEPVVAGLVAADPRDQPDRAMRYRPEIAQEPGGALGRAGRDRRIIDREYEHRKSGRQDRAGWRRRGRALQQDHPARGALNHGVRHRPARQRPLPASQPVDAQGHRERRHDQREGATARRGSLPGQAGLIGRRRFRGAGSLPLQDRLVSIEFYDAAMFPRCWS